VPRDGRAASTLILLKLMNFAEINLDFAKFNLDFAEINLNFADKTKRGF